MLTIPREDLVEPFAKINVWVKPDRLQIRGYILVEQTLEGAVTGIAIDGSGTMKPWYGAQGGSAQNKVAPIARNMCNYLAMKLDYRGMTDVIYWATGDDGKAIEIVGTITQDEASKYPFAGPKSYGLHTCLTPAIQHFVNSQDENAKICIYIFITDGRLEDLDEVKDLTTQLAKELEAKKRVPIKLILIGVGSRLDETQFIELDNLDTGTNQDLWDYKVAGKMDQLAEIFTEMVDQQIIIAERGAITDMNGNIVKDYRDTGVPALLEFDLPADSTSFSLELNNYIIVQPLKIPPSST